MVLLGMLIVGLVEIGPDVFQLQLLSDSGEIVEYTLSKKWHKFLKPINDGAGRKLPLRGGRLGAYMPALDMRSSHRAWA